LCNFKFKKVILIVQLKIYYKLYNLKYIYVLIPNLSTVIVRINYCVFEVLSFLKLEISVTILFLKDIEYLNSF